MVKVIARESVEQFIRDSMEPIPYTKLIDEFTYPSTKMETRKSVKAQLEGILSVAIDSGSIVQYKDHFFSSYLPEDLENVVQIMEEEDLPPVLSQISFTSFESLETVKPSCSEEDTSPHSSNVADTSESRMKYLQKQSLNYL